MVIAPSWLLVPQFDLEIFGCSSRQLLRNDNSPSKRPSRFGVYGALTVLEFLLGTNIDAFKCEILVNTLSEFHAVPYRLPIERNHPNVVIGKCSYVTLKTLLVGRIFGSYSAIILADSYQSGSFYFDCIHVETGVDKA